MNCIEATVDSGNKLGVRYYPLILGNSSGGLCWDDGGKDGGME